MRRELIDWLVEHAKGSEWHEEADWPNCDYCGGEPVYGERHPEGYRARIPGAGHKDDCEYVRMMAEIAKEHP